MLEVGKSYSISVTATDEVIKNIAKISGDVNPIHLNDEYAASSIFGRRIAHGLFCINAISMIIGNYLPGPGAVLVEQSFQYKKPVYIGDEIRVTVTVRERMCKDLYLLNTICRNQVGQLVLDGVSKIKWEEDNETIGLLERTCDV